MPYKDPENKRKWEQEHRELRNAQRQQRRLEMESWPVAPKRVPDPVAAKESTSGWKLLMGLAVGVGIIVLSALGAVDTTGRTS
jgi:hypothetical protein